MTVRRKTLAIVGLTCMGLTAVLYGASHFFLLGGFVAIEQADARKNVERARSAFGENIAAIDRFIVNRSAWDVTYDFMENRRAISFGLSLGEMLRELPPLGDTASFFSSTNRLRS